MRFLSKKSYTVEINKTWKEIDIKEAKNEK